MLYKNLLGNFMAILGFPTVGIEFLQHLFTWHGTPWHKILKREMISIKVDRRINDLSRPKPRYIRSFEPHQLEPCFLQSYNEKKKTSKSENAVDSSTKNLKYQVYQRPPIPLGTSLQCTGLGTFKIRSEIPTTLGVRVGK